MLGIHVADQSLGPTDVGHARLGGIGRAGRAQYRVRQEQDAASVQVGFREDGLQGVFDGLIVRNRSRLGEQKRRRLNS